MGPPREDIVWLTVASSFTKVRVALSSLPQHTALSALAANCVGWPRNTPSSCSIG